MNDDDYKVIGQAFSQLTEADLQRINALLLDASTARTPVPARLYAETWENFSKAVKPLRKIRNGFRRLPLDGAEVDCPDY
ncbi:hypothetical protein FACHB389_35320 [Nostoc calcicola FACHB-389]|nr:hypothetical protein FACHB389_35320 [Nostoc calcicola FACHB-389]